MRNSIQFIVLTYAVSWTVAAIVILLGLHDTKGPSYMIFAAGYMLLPAFCAIILQTIHREKPFKNLRVSFHLNVWFIVAGIVPVIIAFMAMGISLLFPNISFSANYKGMFSALPADKAADVIQQLSKFPPIVLLFLELILAIFAGYTINAIFGLGEDLGWRGYLLSTLKNKKMLPTSLIIGIVWGVWHFPLILLGHNYPQHPYVGVAMMIVMCILLTPTMIYLVIKSKSVIPAAIFHGTFNAIYRISDLYLVGGNDLTTGVTGVAGMVTLLLVNFGFCFYDRYITKENVFTKVIGEY